MNAPWRRALPGRRGAAVKGAKEAAMTTPRWFSILTMLLLLVFPALATAQTAPPATPGPRVSSTAPVDLGTLPGGLVSWARAINDAGQVVGASQVSSGAGHAFLWEKGAMTDLGTLGGHGS